MNKKRVVQVPRKVIPPTQKTVIPARGSVSLLGRMPPRDAVSIAETPGRELKRCPRCGSALETAIVSHVPLRRARKCTGPKCKYNDAGDVIIGSGGSEPPPPVFGDSPHGPFSPSIVEDLGADWTIPANALASSNSTYATCGDLISTMAGWHISPGGGGVGSSTLYVRGFGFAIPTNATINGVLIEIQCHYSGTGGGVITTDSAVDSAQVTLVSPSDSGDNKGADAGDFPASDAYLSYGGASDVWGFGLTDADVNDDLFGVQIKVSNKTEEPALAKAFINHVRATVWFTTA